MCTNVHMCMCVVSSDDKAYTSTACSDNLLSSEPARRDESHTRVCAGGNAGADLFPVDLGEAHEESPSEPQRVRLPVRGFEHGLCALCTRTHTHTYTYMHAHARLSGTRPGTLTAARPKPHVAAYSPKQKWGSGAPTSDIEVLDLLPVQHLQSARHAPVAGQPHLSDGRLAAQELFREEHGVLEV